MENWDKASLQIGGTQFTEQTYPAATPSGSETNQPIVSKFTLKATGEEAKAYDFKAERPPGKTINVFESVGHLVKSCLGGGVVVIHEAYMNCGLWSALVLNIILGFAVAYCMYMLAKSAQKAYGRVKIPVMSYPDLAEASLIAGPWDDMRQFGKTFRHIVDVIVMIDMFGSCCVYQAVMAKSIKVLIEGTTAYTDEENLSIKIYIILLSIPCIVLCMIRTLKNLAPFSIIADVLIVTVAASTVYYGIQTAELSPTDFPVFNTPAGVFKFVAICVFSLEGVGATLSIENSMTEPKKMPLVIILGMSIVVIILMVIGFFGYWGFGEAAQSPVTLNFPMTPYPIVLNVFMVLMVWVTFALNFWIPFNLVWVYMAHQCSSEKHWIWERVYRVIFIITLTAIGICFPKVIELIGVIGAITLSNMGFIFPAIIELSLDWDDPGLGCMKWRLIKTLIIITFGLLLCIIGTYASISELFTEVFVTDKTSLDV